MNNHFNFTTTNNFKALSLLCQQVHDLLNERDVPGEKSYAVVLALEEMISNTIKYGYDDDDDDNHTIAVKLDLGQEITLTLDDDGHRFDPLQNGPVNIATEIDERQIGGMGIHLTKSMTKTMNYSRENSRNILTITI